MTSIGTWIRAFGRRTELDERLAKGEAPESDGALAMRAGELTSERSREELAESVVEAVASAEHPTKGRFRANLALDIPEVRKVRPQLSEIEARLRDGAPVNPRGVAMVSVLLRDGNSPMYSVIPPISGDPPSRPKLRTQVKAALDHLDL